MLIKENFSQIKFVKHQQHIFTFLYFIFIYLENLVLFIYELFFIYLALLCVLLPSTEIKRLL